MKRHFNIFAYLLGVAILPLFLTGCKKETDVFEVNEFHVRNSTPVKGTQKSSLELISIAHFDLFGSEISGQELNQLMVSYSSFGDKQAVIERIIQNFLMRPNVDVPSPDMMRKDVRLFVEQAYRKFYSRQAAEQEIQFFVKMINDSPEMEPKDVYYAFLTSNEYFYY